MKQNEEKSVTKGTLFILSLHKIMGDNKSNLCLYNRMVHFIDINPLDQSLALTVDVCLLFSPLCPS